MSLQPTVEYIVPSQTARVAKAAFPKGTLCLQIYDQLGKIFQDQDFAEVFAKRGQPAAAPFRLALVTVLQYVEGLSDRQAADAVRSRLDWKYLLCLDLEDAGFDYSVLCEFRGRLLNGGLETRLLEKLLDLLKARQLVKGRVRARTDATHVVAAVREMNRLELVVETIRATLNVLATVLPEWVQQTLPTAWIERYGPRAENYRLPAEAHYSKKRDTSWLGYKVHVTESCDETLPNLILQVHTTASVVADNEVLPVIHRKLHQVDLLPDTHFVDSGYVEAKHLVDSRERYGVDLFGPVQVNRHRQRREGHGFDVAHFHIDWDTQRVTCPAGHVSPPLHLMTDSRGHEVLHTLFRREDCGPCQARLHCTSAVTRRRAITVKPKPLYDALNAARERQETDAFKEQYKKRAGVEGTILQGVRAFELRRTRYRGYAKTGLPHIAMAVAINLVRLGHGSAGLPPGPLANPPSSK